MSKDEDNMPAKDEALSNSVIWEAFKTIIMCLIIVAAIQWLWNTIALQWLGISGSPISVNNTLFLVILYLFVRGILFFLYKKD